MNQINDLKEQLKEKLREIFQFESSDLDFGIYKIMNYKRKEIETFIEQELIDEIKRQLSLLSEEERKVLETKLREISSKNGVKKYLEALKNNDEERAKIYREDFAKDIDEYEKLKKQLDEVKISEGLERAIYNHLINFFTCYYDNGDFISQRRYGKNERYIIPYNGEKVLLYWANRDQYYIKTTEYFKSYTFNVNGLKVNFKVVEAEEEKGNVKAQEKKFFVLNEKIFDFNNDKKELNIYFEYRCLTEEEENKYKQGQSASQEKINEAIINTLKERLQQNSLTRVIFENDPNNGKTFIERHLSRYTKRNTRDYFIHKDLKGFLERELDFYIKNEFLQLEDLQVLGRDDYLDKLRLYLIGARVFREIALKIIEFLAQIEDFQKRIWEKKKFVIDTNYVITLDKIKEYAGEEFLESILDKILSNEKQLEEWKELFGIEVKSINDLISNNTLDGKEWKKLPLDTRYFSEEFKYKLLSKINNLDDRLDGVLIKSDNWQALNLLMNKYYEKVQTIYIDPPFNKEQEADYLYKVGYKDSTWITMLENRLRLARDLLNEKGSIFVRCDYNGNMYVRLLMNEIFGKENFRNEIDIKRNQALPKTGDVNLIEETENLYVFSKTDKFYFTNQLIDREEPEWVDLGTRPSDVEDNPPRLVEGKEFYPPKYRRWAYSQENIDDMYAKGRLKIENGKIKILLDKRKLGSNWTAIPGYSTVPTWGLKTENSEILLKRVIESTSNKEDLIMDFFLGSGTTTAVAHKLKRKWIGVEIGEHFNTIVLPRMKKVLFYDKSGISNEKDVKEIYNKKMAGGFFKYHTLEQYEDALENIEFEEAQETLYKFYDYFIKYMLEWETKNSKTFLNIDKMKDPFNYRLKIIENYQQKEVNVDLIETFNYLLGLEVNRYKFVKEDDRKYVFVFGVKDGKRVAIVWRSIEDIDFEKDKTIIEENLKNYEPDEIYTNGDAIIKDFRPIEPLFKSLMFEGVR